MWQEFNRSWQETATEFLEFLESPWSLPYDVDMGKFFDEERE